MELTSVEEKVDRLEALFGQFMAQTNRALIRMEKGMEQMQTEMSEALKKWHFCHGDERFGNVYP